MKYIILTTLLLWSFMGHSQTKKGFDLSNSTIPLSEIKDGGPPKDGITSIDEPQFSQGSRAQKKYSQEERALVVEHGEQKKAYPISILNWHEIVNDKINDIPIAVTFCPLCGTGMVFHSMIKGKQREFGVSGLLYNSDVLLYDRQSDSLWSQIATKSISGPLAGKELQLFPSKHVKLNEYLKDNPETSVLTPPKGSGRNYDESPYSSYKESNSLYFDVKNLDKSYHLKTWTLLVKNKNSQTLIPLKEVEQKQNLNLTLGDEKIDVHVDSENRIFKCDINEKSDVECITGFWFALRSFYPQAEIWKSD